MADIESEEFNDMCVRGFHVYKDVWRPVIGEELRCQREEDNPRGPYAVAVTKSRTGVVDFKISAKISSDFLSKCTGFLLVSGPSAITKN